MRNIKKIGFLLTAILMTLVIFLGCEKKDEIQGIDKVALDGIYLGANLASLDLEKYTPEKKKKLIDKHIFYKEIELRIDNDNCVAGIEGNVAKLALRIGETSNFFAIEDVTEIMGKSYEEDWHDKEQYLMKHTYVDYKNGMKAMFVYKRTNCQLTKVTMERI